jgi:hypothetical protein
MTIHNPIKSKLQNALVISKNKVVGNIQNKRPNYCKAPLINAQTYLETHKTRHFCVLK